MTKIRTRFAPSPTGRMHVGNLRSALYEFLIAKHDGGDFMLRIEDTDQERFVEGAVDIIYDTLAKAGLSHDEGPDKDGGYGPYVQSERMKTGIYMKYAKELIDKGEAYYCFCDKEMGLQCFEPYGAFYVFPCIKEFGMTSDEFAERLLREEKVAVVPGTAFGDCGEGFLRISYAYSLENLQIAMEKIEAFIKRLREEKR